MQTQGYTTFNFEISNDKVDIIHTIKTLLKAYKIENKVDKPSKKKSIMELSGAFTGGFSGNISSSEIRENKIADK